MDNETQEAKAEARITLYSQANCLAESKTRQWRDPSGREEEEERGDIGSVK